MDWFVYDRDLSHEKVKNELKEKILIYLNNEIISISQK